MRKVYRFEIVGTGKGVHASREQRSEKTADIISEWLDVYYDHTNERPTAHNDFDKYDFEDYLFGCKSLNALINWFNFRTVKAFDELLTCEDVELVIYKTPKYIEGKSKKQVIFRRNEAIRKVVAKGKIQNLTCNIS